MNIKKLFGRLSLLPHGIRYKLLIAFSLMSVIPLLVIGYLLNNFIFLHEEPSVYQGSVLILFCIIIAWLGLFLAKNIIERVIDVSLESRIIKDGDYERRIKVESEDEIGAIGEAINFLTIKIKNNIADLRDYQDKMKEINVEIQKRVSVLSNLLQIGEVISSSVKLDSTLELILAKLAQLYEGGFAGLYFSEEKGGRFSLRASQRLENKLLSAASFGASEGVVGKALSKKKQVVVDDSSKFSPDEQGFRTKYKCENAVIFPIFAVKGTRVLLLVGNEIKNFTYTSEDLDIIKIFAEQITIAIENDMLIRRAKSLEIRDELTSLFTNEYIVNRLKEEIQRSIISHRPCSFILVDLDNFNEYKKRQGAAKAESALIKVANIISGNSGPLGKVGRIYNDRFAVLMPEVNKKGVFEVAEKIRREIGAAELSEDKADRVTASCGVSENPLDGGNAEEILQKAEKALDSAKKKGKNLTEGLEV